MEFENKIWLDDESLGYIDITNNDNSRVCNECMKKMYEGYVIENGFEYYCSDECLHKHYTEEEYLELYDNGNGDSYYTEWEREDIK